MSVNQRDAHIIFNLFKLSFQVQNATYLANVLYKIRFNEFYQLLVAYQGLIQS